MSKKNLYVGRNDDVAQRLQQHSRRNAPHKQASFAFRLAREACGIMKATKREVSRADLVSQESFKAAFAAQKARVLMMEIRVVKEADAVRQAPLEMYVPIALGTPYNDFNTS